MPIKKNALRKYDNKVKKIIKDTWIVIPAHNEGKNIGKVITGCRKYVKNVVVVDDGSEDNTGRIAKEKGAVVLRHLVNLGKGCSAKTGCDYCFKNKAKIIILVDADGQHDPDLIPLFIKKLRHSDIVIGVRGLNKRMPFVLRMGNNFINYLINLLFHVKIRDSQSGYRAFWARHYGKIRWKAQDYSMESEMIANIGHHKLKYAQLPIKTIYTDDYKGTTIIDGVRIVYHIIKWRLARL